VADVTYNSVPVFHDLVERARLRIRILLEFAMRHLLTLICPVVIFLVPQKCIAKPPASVWQIWQVMKDKRPIDDPTVKECLLNSKRYFSVTAGFGYTVQKYVFDENGKMIYHITSGDVGVEKEAGTPIDLSLAKCTTLGEKGRVSIGEKQYEVSNGKLIEIPR
jgi:hypothetical protein